MMKNNIAILIVLFIYSCSSVSKQESLPFYNTPDFTPQWISQATENTVKLHTIAPFNFINQNNRPITNKDLRGKIYVANFFFTTCGSICPRIMNNLKKVQAAFPGDTSILILSHSVLPELDSVNRLKKYEQRLKIDGNQWWLLTGNKNSIYQLARKSYFADEESGYNKGSNEFLHTENCVLIDVNGHIRGVYNATLELEIDKLIRDIKRLAD